MKIAIEIKTDNAAFKGNRKAAEISRIIEDVKISIEFGTKYGTITDINGNNVGRWGVN